MEKQKKGLAIAALVLGIIGLALSFLPIINNAAFIFGVIGLVLGVVALFRKNQKVLTIIAIVMNVLAMGITLALQSSWSKALDDASKEIDKTADDASGKNTESLLGSVVDVQLGNFEATSDEYGMVTSALNVTVTNLSDESTSFSITIEAVNPDGSRLATDYVYAHSLGGQQSMNQDVFTLIPSEEVEAYRNASYKVLEVSKY